MSDRRLIIVNKQMMQQQSMFRINNGGFSTDTEHYRKTFSVKLSLEEGQCNII